MALTTIPSELSSVSGISDSSTSTAITIDSSQNVTFAGNVTTGSNTISGVLSSVTGSLGSAATATTQAASATSAHRGRHIPQPSLARWVPELVGWCRQATL